MGDGGAGARTGDHIRARTADRDALAVEGVLHLRHIPAKDYVQVRLINDDEDGELMLWPRDENSSSKQGVPLTGIAQVTDELLANALDEVT